MKPTVCACVCIGKVVDDNTPDAHDRDALNADIDNLRHLRVDRGNM